VFAPCVSGRTPLDPCRPPHDKWAPLVSLRNLLEPSYTIVKNSKLFSDTLIDFLHMNFIVWTLLNLLVTSIPSEMSNKHRSSPLSISHYYPSDIER
jgi:hypothetical protein